MGGFILAERFLDRIAVSFLEISVGIQLSLFWRSQLNTT